MIANVANDQVTGGYPSPETLAQIVENDNAFAAFSELPYNVTANVAGTAGDQNRPVRQIYPRRFYELTWP
jgi:hypothetical protein